MHCFNHQDSEAVGICIRCGAGVCGECATRVAAVLCPNCLSEQLSRSPRSPIDAEEVQAALAERHDRLSSNEDLSCSFCGKSQREINKLIAGPTVSICDECIDLCNDIIGEEYGRDTADDPESTE